MNCGEDDSPSYISTYTGPYSSSIASSASSSSASVWSDVSSQTSDDSSVTGAASDSETSETYCRTTLPPPSFTAANGSCAQGIPITSHWSQNQKIQHTAAAEASPKQRQHPRRTSVGAAARPQCPPSLVRQSDRKINFVDGLVDSSAQIVEAIWPLSSVACRTEMGTKGVLPLRTFIQETLRRSRTSYSTLQVALYYLILIKPHVPNHDFTMEQPDDVHANRALQCGRRMFLSALILASKYLQDRNYSSRAWSKISGLNIKEINENEMAFLIAVNWQLHITDAVFQRWTDIVVKYTHTLPPSPGTACPRLAEKSADCWKSVILKLNPELDNIEDGSPSAVAQANVKSISATSPRRSCMSMVSEPTTFGYGSNEATPTPTYYTPMILEPSPVTGPPARPAPALGMLPTPRLTPQSSGFNTPAVCAVSSMLCRPAMGLAMAHSANVGAAQFTEKWQQTSSPQSYVCNRRSSLANSVSSVSSPESMVSDSSSRSSRSSSISSASSLMSAPISSKLDVQARCRSAKLCSEKMKTICTVPEAFCESSPDNLTIPVGKNFNGLSLDTPLARRAADLDEDEEAARALQELHNNPRESPNRAGAKRSRPLSIVENSLQENVREMLNGQYQFDAKWSDLIRPLGRTTSIYSNDVDINATSPASISNKRARCSAEATGTLQQTKNLHPALGGFGGPGMWEGILN